MGRYINLGNESFMNIRNSEYVDKTGFIAVVNSYVNSMQKLICVSRPRRFGKSVGTKTLCAYYDRSCDSEKLFCDLEIAKDKSFKKYLNKFPVIYLDITWFISNCKDIKQTVDYLERSVGEELKKNYPDADGKTLAEIISGIVEKTDEKFVIIIDEWDALFREAKTDFELQKEYVSFLRGLFKSSLTDKMFALAYMTGILPIKKYGTQSALTDFKEYTMLSPKRFARYVGFTESEVKNLCEKYDVDFEETKKWYNGYSFSQEKAVYSPNSVIEAMLNGEFDDYWAKTETFESLRVYIDMDFDGVRNDLAFMLGGGECKINPLSFQNDMTSIASKDDVFTLFVHLGYLSFNSENSTVRIPNKEVRQEFLTAIKNSSRKEISKMILDSEKLLEDTLSGNESAVAKAFERIHDSVVAPNFYNNEQALRSVIRFAYISAVDDYVQIQELPSGKGYADIVFIPRKSSSLPAIIVELKWNKSPESALEQMKTRNYPCVVSEFSGEIVLVGINYDEKKGHECRIEKIDKK